MIYLLGVSHEVQTLPKLSSTQTFLNYLNKKIDELGITMLAEEASKDTLRAWRAKQTTVQSVAVKRGVKYLACDPTRHIRSRLGIRTKKDILNTLGLKGVTPTNEYLFLKEKFKDYSIRERYWLEKLAPYKDEKVIFVIGCKHLSCWNHARHQGFDTLLLNEGIGFEVLKEVFDNIEGNKPYQLGK